MSHQELFDLVLSLVGIVAVLTLIGVAIYLVKR